MKRFNEGITLKDSNEAVQQRVILDKSGITFYYNLLANGGFLSSQGVTGLKNWLLPNKSGTLETKETSIRTVSATTTLALTDKTLNISSGTFTVDIVTAIGNAGITFEIVNSGDGIVTLDAFSTETIGGSLTLVIPVKCGITIKSDGANWIIVDKFRQETLNRNQWIQSISPTTINNNTSLNLLTLITDANKLANGTDGGFYELSIATNKILTKWGGVPMTHHIRVIGTMTLGTDQHYQLTLRRFSDNAVLSSTKLSRDNDTGVFSADFLTYTYSATDPFVTNGFYIQLDNGSGAAVEIVGSINLLIATYFK